MMADMRKFDAIISQRDGKQVVVEDLILAIEFRFLMPLNHFLFFPDHT